jgi:hypothetical protein
MGGTSPREMQSPTPIPLTAEDRAILALERGPVAGHTCKVVVLGDGAPSAESLREAVARRIGAAPGLRRRLAGPVDAPVWAADDDFDIARHVVGVGADELVERASLGEFVARVFAERLPRDRPLWRMDVVPLADGGGAVVWRIHHALADGSTVMRYASEVLWDEADGPPAGQASARAADDDTRRRGHLARFVRREFARSRRRSPFDAPLAGGRDVAFASVDLRAVHDAAKRTGGATLNDAVLATVTGAVGAWLRRHHGSLGELRVKVPVSLHHLGDDPGNRDSFFVVSVPLDERDPLARLRATQAATAERKHEHDAEEMDALLERLARTSPALEHLCDRLERSGRSFAVNVSNVPGPRAALSVLGASVREVYSIAEIAEHHALRVAVVSATGRLHFGLCADPTVVDGLATIATDIEAEAAALVRAADAG